jgi:hypothetical protein
VECIFGITKKRFRILQSGVRNGTALMVDNLFLTCCCLHNLVHKHNEWDEEQVYEDLDEGGDENDDLPVEEAVNDDAEGGAEEKFTTSCHHDTNGNCYGRKRRLVDSVTNVSTCQSCIQPFHLLCAKRHGAHSRSGYCSSQCEESSNYDHEARGNNAAGPADDPLLDADGASVYEDRAQVVGEHVSNTSEREHFALRTALAEHYAIWNHKRREGDIARNAEQLHGFGV